MKDHSSGTSSAAVVHGRLTEPLTAETFCAAYRDHLYYSLAVRPEFATLHDRYFALSLTVRDRLVQRWLATLDAIIERRGRMVFYFSAEFLPGRQLCNGLLHLGAREFAERALAQDGICLEDVMEQEPEPALGNGGLGRLAACFLDSLATRSIPAFGYGIRYQFGIFQQRIMGGWQVEFPDEWLSLGNPWEIARPERKVTVGFGGRTEWFKDANGSERVRWIPDKTIEGVPFDTMIPGYGTSVVNTLRLWHAQATDEFDFGLFNAGDYAGAVEKKVASETLTKVLYPNDSTEQGRELRLKQEYFFIACSLRDLIKNAKRFSPNILSFADLVAIQLNDTHPALTIVELMRILVDEEELGWDIAWEKTRQICSFTNHTLLSEALEKWSCSLMHRLLPRHLEIIFELNQRFLADVAFLHPGDNQKLQRLSLIEEGSEKRVRMAHLAILGSHSTNGVAELHSTLLKRNVFPDFSELFPDRFSNKTNGISPRRWLLLTNPLLSSLISEAIGDRWISELERLQDLEKFVSDESFCTRWTEIKQQNKKRLAEFIAQKHGTEISANTLFNSHAKRIHEYKRQLLKVLHVISLYHKLRSSPEATVVPRTVIFAGKAAPAYRSAKLIIKLINSVAEVVNRDSSINHMLKVVFLEDFSVKAGERLYPATDLSEQISTAGYEASGTGNMKFALNGALTIGTLDGANIEIRERVGAQNFFLFGNTVDSLAQLRSHGYHPTHYINSDSDLKHALDALRGPTFSPQEPDLFRPLIQELEEKDTFFLCADFAAYCKAQVEAEKLYLDSNLWTKKSILSTSRMGFFSSDRAIDEYCRDVWRVTPLRPREQ